MWRRSEDVRVDCKRDLATFVKPHMRLSMEQVARYMRVDARTIRRWQKDRGFPMGHRTGHHEVSFFADEIVAWEQKMRLATEKA